MDLFRIDVFMECFSAKDACCPICADEFEDRPLFNCECCSNVLHKDCLRPYVFNAGTYFLKCPFCQDVDKFKNLIDRFCGIHIPTREPTYEDHDRMVVELVCAYEFCPDPDKLVYSIHKTYSARSGCFQSKLHCQNFKKYFPEIC